MYETSQAAVSSAYDEHIHNVLTWLLFALTRHAHYTTLLSLPTLQEIPLLLGLQILDVSNNQLKSVAGLSSLQHLQDLWLNDNQILELEDVNAELDGCRSTLTCVYLSCNPATRNNPLYKQCMLRWLPKLQQLDADYVRGAP